VIFDQAPFREALRAAQAALTAAQHAYDRAKTLSAEGIIPRKDFDQATADLARARNDVVVARRFEQLSVLRSPISGVVTQMLAVLGASADVNQPLVQVADPSALDIILGTTPASASKIHQGDKVQLRAGQNPAGESLGIGTVLAVGAVLDTAARNVPIRATLPAATRPLKIGETVYGEIAVATRANAIVVPVDALVPDGDKFKVFVVDAKNVAHARPVVVGARDSKTAEIKSGLAPGERVVTYGAYGLDDGVTVVPAR
jgi:RND family efflux transporter MFP subunit